MNEDNLASLIKQSNVLLSVLARAQLRSVMETELADSKKRQLYGLTDGLLTARQLSPRVGLSIATISRTWQHWEDCGLIIKEDGRYRRILP